MKRLSFLLVIPMVMLLAAGKKGIDSKLASKGKKLFVQKGCNACHTIGKGRLVGPDLKGVTKKRKYKWLIAMITGPDSMLKYDEIAKSLLKEYGTPMPNQKVSVEEAKAIIEYLRQESEK